MDNLSNSKEAQKYLESRGFHFQDDIIKEMKVGYAEDNYFENYVVFPLYYKNQPVFLTGRSIKENNHKHLPGKINYFYNHDELFYNNELILVEGPFDCLSLLSCDFPAIASLGAGKLPEKFTDIAGKKIIVLYDTDINLSGEKGAKSIAQRLSEVTNNIYIAHIPLLNGEKKVDINDLFIRDKTKDKRIFIRRIEQIINHADKFKPEKLPERKYYDDENGDDWKVSYDIVEIIGQYVELFPAGTNTYKGICCFHPDSNPSLTVYQHTQSYFCYGCKSGGSIVDFLIHYHGYSFQEVKEFLKLNYG